MASTTSRDVARVAGVAQSTVSYVLTGKRPISEKTRKRVQAAIEQLTYHPNAGARALASQRTSVIGLMVPFGPASDATGLLPFIETIASLARARDYDVLLVTSDEGSAGLRRLAGRALCDAIVLMDVLARDDRVPVAASLAVPVILIGVPEDAAGLRCVDLDFARAAEMAVEELAAVGHDRIAFLGYRAGITQRDLNFARRFLEAGERAAKRHSIPYDVIAPIDPGRAGAQAAVARALAGRGARRRGLVVPNSVAVQPVLDALAARGLVPGRDVSVIGLCTDDDAEETDPPVTNVSLEPREVSRQAMETLFRLLDRNAPPQAPAIELVTPRLTRRSTVLPPAPARRSAAGRSRSLEGDAAASDRAGRPATSKNAATGGARRRDDK